MRFEPTVRLLRKSSVYGLNGQRTNYVMALSLGGYADAIWKSRSFTALFSRTSAPKLACWCDFVAHLTLSKTNPSWQELLAFGYPVGLPVFAVATCLVFATDAAVARGLSLRHHGGDSTHASVVFWRHKERLFVRV
jgi:hypothetical protein